MKNLLQFNTSWLLYLRKWYYFRRCFSFSCSGYELEKNHILNCYSFLKSPYTRNIWLESEFSYFLTVNLSQNFLISFIFKISIWKVLRLVLNSYLKWLLISLTPNDWLSAQGSIKRPVRTRSHSWGKSSYEPPGPNKCPGLACLSAQVNLGANLKKKKRKIFVINFGRNFRRNFLSFVKDLPPWHFLLFILIHFFDKLQGLIRRSLKKFWF